MSGVGFAFSLHPYSDLTPMSLQLASMEVSLAEFARMAGVSRAAISTKKKNHTLVINSAGKLDTDNPLNRSYLDRRRQMSQQQFAARQIAEEATAQTTSHVRSAAYTAAVPYAGNATGTTGAAQEALNMTLRDLVIKHGSIDNIERYAKILRDLTAADERDQKIQARRLTQVPRDFVVSRLFSFEDQLMNKLLDVPENVVDQIIAVALADSDTKRQDIINILNDNLTRCVAGSKEHIINEVNALRGKYERQETEADALAELNDRLDTIQRET